MKTNIFLLLSLLLITQVFSQGIKQKPKDFSHIFVPSEQDEWMSNDKGYHLFGSSCLNWVLHKKTPLTRTQAAFATIGIGVLYEIQQGTVNWTQELEIFSTTEGKPSWKDMVANTAGVVLYNAVDLLLKDHQKKKQKKYSINVNGKLRGTNKNVTVNISFKL